uniref:Epithelial membrane protein 1 n=2 Tax=Anser TaxID=8842 RepID=A0A8B9BKM0_9AVES
MKLFFFFFLPRFKGRLIHSNSFKTEWRDTTLAYHRGNLNQQQVTPLHYGSALRHSSTAAPHAPASTGASTGPSPPELSALATPPRKDAKMLVLLAGIFVVHIATVIMLFVSTIANVWMVGNTTMGRASWGLWLMCNGTCRQLTVSSSEAASLKAAQAFMILSIIFSVIALVMFIVQLFTLEKGKRFYITGAIMLVCWLCILIGASIYTARFTGLRSGFTNVHHGYSFILAWICFCFSFIIGILYLVLRKK